MSTICLLRTLQYDLSATKDKQLLECTVSHLSTAQIQDCVIQSWGGYENPSFNQHFLLLKGRLLFEPGIWSSYEPFWPVGRALPSYLRRCSGYQILLSLVYCAKTHNLNIFAFCPRFWEWKTHGTAIPNRQRYECIPLTRRFWGHQLRYDDCSTLTPTPSMNPYAENYWTSWDRACGNRPFIPQGVISHRTARSAVLGWRNVIPTWDNCASGAVEFGDILKELEGRLPLGRWVQMTERVSDYLAILRTVWWLMSCQVPFIWVPTTYRFLPKPQHHVLKTLVSQVNQNNTLSSILCVLRDPTHRMILGLVYELPGVSFLHRSSTTTCTFPPPSNPIVWSSPHPQSSHIPFLSSPMCVA